MPISKEHQALYPENWAEIRKRILERAGWKCEWCGAKHGDLHPETGSRVVLTIGHLGHDPENRDEANLAALCQRCHLRYDLKEHVAHAAETRRAKREAGGQVPMFAVGVVKEVGR